MLNYLKNILIGANDNSNEPSDSDKSISPEKRIQVATCAVFIELANTDDEFSEDEKKLIYSLMKSEFDLSSSELDELMEETEEKIKHNVSLYEYTQVINDHFSKDEKYQLLKRLWKLVFVDEKLDSHEEYFIRKLSGNLHMEHKEMIAAKLEVKKELGF
jgi:uncharacterized tellurite resistance protein B-like protein